MHSLLVFLFGAKGPSSFGGWSCGEGNRRYMVARRKCVGRILYYNTAAGENDLHQEGEK